MAAPELSLESYQFLIDMPVPLNPYQYRICGNDENAAMEKLARLGYVVKVRDCTQYYVNSTGSRRVMSQTKRVKAQSPTKEFVWGVTLSGAEFLANLRVLANV